MAVGGIGGDASPDIGTNGRVVIVHAALDGTAFR